MKYYYYSENPQSQYSIAIVSTTVDMQLINKEYIDGHFNKDDVVVLQLQTDKAKPTSTFQKTFLQDLIPVLNQFVTKFLICTSSDYFKTLTGLTKADPYVGYSMPLKFPKEFEGTMQVFYVPTYKQLFYNPDKTRFKITQGIQAVKDKLTGVYQPPGSFTINPASYLYTFEDIRKALKGLIDSNADVACDIETFSLKFHKAKLGTIGFATDQSNGFVFPVDFHTDKHLIRQLLKEFFTLFKGKLIFHNISYDVSVLIYELYMNDVVDTEGLLYGLDVFFNRPWDDTKLIAYLATNTCAGNELGLKPQSQEFSGNYAKEDIKDINLIPLSDLLEYNLIDCFSTWYVYNKHYQTIIDDNQLDIYENLFKPAIVDIVQMQLTGLPIDMDKVKAAKAELEIISDNYLNQINNNRIIQNFVLELQQDHVNKRNAALKTKQIGLTDAETLAITFNSNSAPQKQQLLYDYIGLPVIAYTKSKQPATDADTLEKLISTTNKPEVIDLIKALLGFTAVDKIYTTFIPAMEEAVQDSNGDYWLFGNFNLGGTVSGRLSSSGPNLQTIPSTGTIYAKLIKDCIIAPKGWVFVGLDFDSLEDKISALITRDPNKLKVYTDGYDGHSLRAFSYFGTQMAGIDETSVKSINSIADVYPDLRQRSKAPTFLLTYGGTFRGLMANCGFTQDEAVNIETKYHNLYQVSDQWVAARIAEAANTGYITGAFGLRVRTPITKQTVRGTSKTPYEAESEARTAGNALGQSWCLLNTRAGIQFMNVVRASKYRLDIRPCAHIHDAQYYLVRENPEILLYLNDKLVEAVSWQEHPLIVHDKVKLSGKLSVFYPSWAYSFNLPNHCNEATLYECIATHKDNLKKKDIR